MLILDCISRYRFPLPQRMSLLGSRCCAHPSTRRSPSVTLAVLAASETMAAPRQRSPWQALLRLSLLLLALATAPASSASTTATVLVVGDSISAAYGIREQDGWVALLAQQLALDDPDITVANASISGDTTDGGLQRLPDALQRIQPELLIIELGGNDGLRGQSLKQMRENLIGMIELGQANDAEVLVLGMQIPTNYGPAYRQRFAGTFAKAADATNAALVPFFLEPIALQRDYFQPDGVHPTADAQPLMLQHVMPVIRQLLRIDCEEQSTCKP